MDNMPFTPMMSMAKNTRLSILVVGGVVKYGKVMEQTYATQGKGEVE
jgi:hypothetical protein